MEPTITSEIVVAYSQCPRKAYLLLFSPDKGEPHEYVQILEQQRREHQERYIDHLQQTHADVQPYSLENLRKGSKVLSNAHLQVDGLAADCGVLTRVEGTSTFGKHSYDPSIFVGTHSVSKDQQLELSFVGYVLEGSVSKVEMWTPRALIYRVLFPSISTFETPPAPRRCNRPRWLRPNPRP